MNDFAIVPALHSGAIGPQPLLQEENCRTLLCQDFSAWIRVTRRVRVADSE